MSDFRAGTRPGERTSASIREVEDGELAELFPGQAAGPVKIPRCTDHRRLRENVHGGVVPGCDGCRAEQQALLAIPLQRERDRVPKTLARKSRAWHAAGGGTEQFSLAEYDRRMEER